MMVNKSNFAFALAAVLLVPAAARAQATDSGQPTGIAVSGDDGTATDEATPNDDTKDVRAWCVGGPRQPSYAYRDYNRAERCFQSVASQSRDCRRFARIGGCEVYRLGDLGRFRPIDCRCNPQLGPVGYWD